MGTSGFSHLFVFCGSVPPELWGVSHRGGVALPGACCVCVGGGGGQFCG